MRSVPSPVARHVLRPFAVAVVAAALTAALPAVPAAAEGHRTVVGTLVQAYPEHRSESPATLAAEPLSWVQQADGEAVRVPTDDVADVPAGSTVRVTVGAPVRDSATTTDGYAPARDVVSADVLHAPGQDAAPAASSDTASQDPASSDTASQVPVSQDPPSSDTAASQSTADSTGAAAGGSADPATLTDHVTVAMVVPQHGEQDGATLSQLVAAVDGPVAAFWSEQSHGAVRLGVTAQHDWISVDAACSDPTTLWAETAQKVGFTPGPGEHLLVYVSSRPDDLPGCAYGLAQVGSSLGSGGYLYVRDTLPSIIAHELGHNLGLGHSSEVLCDRAVETGSCQTLPYRDYYDVMGASWEQMGSLNAAQAARLGFLSASAQQSLTADHPGTRDTALAPLAGATGTRALQLTDTAGTQYWLEYRTPTGRDSWLGTAADRFDLQSGVLIHRSGVLPDTSLLLDGTPGPSAGWEDDLQAALPVGTPITVAGGQFTVTVEKQTAAGATVRVATAPAPAAAPAHSRHSTVLPGHRTTATPAPVPDATAVTFAPAPPPLPPIAAAAPAGAGLAPAAATSSTGFDIGMGLAAVGLGGLLLLTTARLRRRPRR